MIYIFSEEEIKNSEPTSSKLKMLYNQADRLRDERNEAINSYENIIQSIILLRKDINNDNNARTLFYMTMGNAYLRYAEMLFRKNKDGYPHNKKALENFKQAKKIVSSTDKPDPRNEAILYLNFGKCHRYIDNQKKAKGYFKEAYSCIKKTSHKDHLDIGCEAINAIAQWHMDKAEHTMAINYYMKTFTNIQTEYYEDIEDVQNNNKNNLLDELNNTNNKLSNQSHNVKSKDNLKKLFRQAILNIGIILKREQDMKVALEVFEFLNRIENRDNIDALNNIGACYRKLNLINAAKKIFQEVNEKAEKKYSNGISENSDNAHKKNFFAEINICKCNMISNIEVAKEELNEILEEHPDNSRSYILNGQFLMEQGKYTDAIQSFNTAKNLDRFLKRHHLKADYLIACCYKKMHKYHEAIKIYSRLLDLDQAGNALKISYSRENDCACLSNLGDCLLALNFYDEALDYYDKACDNFNKNALVFWKEESYESYIEKIIAEEKNVNQEYNEESICINSSLQKNIYADFFYNQGICLYNIYLDTKKDHFLDEALKAFESSILYDNNKVIALFYVAECKKLTGDNSNSTYESINTSLYVDDEVNSKYMIYLINQCTSIIKDNSYTDVNDKLQKILSYTSNGIIYHSLKAILKLIDFCEILNEEVNYNNLKENGIEVKKHIKEIYQDMSSYKLLGANNYKRMNILLDSEDYININENNRGIVFASLIKLFASVIKTKDACRCYPEFNDKNEKINVYKTKSQRFVHYTKLDVLKLLLNKESEKEYPKFRLLNSAYMNDLSEGKVFIKEMTELCSDESRKDMLSSFLANCYPEIINNENNQNDDIIQYHNSNIYLSSLSEEEDNLPMWVHYGQNAEGCTLIFDDDFWDYNYKKPKDVIDDDFDYSEFPLYRVKYYGNKANNDVQHSCSDELKGLIKNVYNELINIQKLIDTNQITDKKQIYRLARYIIDEIRFLFKTDQYSYEREIRVMKNSSSHKLEKSQTFPRLHVEVNQKINLSEVRFAPKIVDFETIMPWLSDCESVRKVKKSSILYK